VGSAAGASPAAAPARPTLILYKSIEIIGDRVVPRYSSNPPASGTFERIER
jgi:hypothetical protein